MAEFWDEILAIANDVQGERLRALVSGAAEPNPAEARAGLADELLDILPPAHPVIRTLRTGVMFGSVHDPAIELAESMRRMSVLVLSAGESRWPAPRGESEPPESAAVAAFDALPDFDRRVQARLLSLPSLSADDVRDSDIDGRDSHVIRLRSPDGAWQWPAFQFRAAAVPWPVVQEVNELLDADGDPWGVMCWWVDPHDRLNAAPADLLGAGQDELLRRAAAAIGAER